MGTDGGVERRRKRRRIEARLDALVREHRFAIAVVFPAVGALGLVASAEGLLSPLLSFDPFLILLGTLVMRSPLIVGVAPVTDRRALSGPCLLVVYAYGIEFLAVLTGIPYGEFRYGVDLGPMLFGEVPLGLPVFFVPLVMNGYLLCLLLLGERARRGVLRVPAVIATVLAIDLVLDPGAVAIGFWEYAAGGAYYGVPWSNYAGWALSATVAVTLLDRAYNRSALGSRLRRCEFMLDDMVSFVLLWGTVNAVYGNWIPVFLATALGTGLVRTDRFDLRVLRTRRASAGNEGQTE